VYWMCVDVGLLVEASCRELFVFTRRYIAKR
jgi:hypothetical protein